MTTGAAVPGHSVDVPSGHVAAIPTPVRGDARLARLSLNQKTTDGWPLPQLVDAAARAGLPALGLWRDPVQAHGLERTIKLLGNAELRVSSLCRGGFLTGTDAAARDRAIEENRRAIDEAAALGASCLVMVVGGIPAGSKDLAGAREQVREGVAALAPYASEGGVRLALEPLHPMYCADRAVLSTLGQAVDLAEEHPVEAVGVVVDAYHVWWDPDVERQIARAGNRIASFQVSDWVLPLASDVLLARGMMGDGCIDLHSLLRFVDEAGYRGDVEVEILNAAISAADGDAVLATVLRRYVTDVLQQA